MTGIYRAGEPEPGVLGSLEPEPLEKKNIFWGVNFWRKKNKYREKFRGKIGEKEKRGKREEKKERKWKKMEEKKGSKSYGSIKEGTK